MVNKTTDTGNPGFASENYPKNKAKQAHRMGGEASGKSSTSGAAGKTTAAKRGGQNSHGGTSS